MKKKSLFKVLALIMIVGFSNLLFAQINLPFQSDFSGVGGSSQSSSASMPQITSQDKMPKGFLYAGSERIYEGGQKLKFGVTESVGVLPTDLINTNGVAFIKVSFKAIGWPSTSSNPIPSAKVVLTYGSQTNEFTVDLATGWPITVSDLVECSCQFTAIATPTSLFIKTMPYIKDGNGCRIFLDDVRIVESNSAQVAAPTFSPQGGICDEPKNVAISCDTEGATIHYTTDGSAPTTASAIYDTPISVTTTTTIKAFAVKDGLEPSSVSSAEYIFSQTVTTLAALRALAPEYNNGNNVGHNVYKYTGKAVVTHMQTFNNVKYIQDGTAAIMVFDTPGKMNEPETRDQITNITGTLTNYFGMIQIVPEGECDIVAFDMQVPATLITASQLDFDNNNPLQAKLVKINNVMYTQTGNFERGKYYNLREGSIVYDSLVYTEKYEADYIETSIPTGYINIIGVCNFKGGAGFKTQNRIVPLDISNNVIQGIHNFNKSAIKLSPNPANSFVNIVTGSPMKLEIYSLLGNLITTESLYEGNNTISVSQYPAGIYLMKFIDFNTGDSYMQKLVVK